MSNIAAVLFTQIKTRCCLRCLLNCSSSWHTCYVMWYYTVPCEVPSTYGTRVWRLEFGPAPCIPLILLTCTTARPETDFLLTFGLPFEGSSWSELGFGFIFSNFVWCLTKIGQMFLWVCFTFLLSRRLFFVSPSYWGVLSLLITKSARPFSVCVFSLITLVQYVIKTICILLTSLSLLTY